MKKIILILICFLTYFFSFSQTQIHSIIDGIGIPKSISSDGSIIAYSEIYENNRIGTVSVYRNNGSSWVKMGNSIAGNIEGDRFGERLSLSSNGLIIAIGTRRYNNSTGKVMIYTFNGNDWIQKGNNIYGNNQGDWFGESISLSSDGSILAVGARGVNLTHLGNGQTSVYHFDGNEWIQIGNVINGTEFGDQLGSSVSLSLDGNTLATSSPSSGVSNNFGHVSIYENINNNWIKKGNDIITDTLGNAFGKIIKLSSNGSLLAVSSNLGVTVFQYINNDWMMIGDALTESDGDNDIGAFMDLSGDGKTLVFSSKLTNANINLNIYRNINGNWKRIAKNFNINPDYYLSTSGNIIATGYGIFELVNDFSGNTDNDWNTNSNWSLNRVPVSTDNVNIIEGTNPIISNITPSVSNLFIEPNTNLTISNNSGLTINFNYDSSNNAKLLCKDGSLIIKKKSLGVINYSRSISDTNWHLISPPLFGDTIDDFIANHPNLATGTNTNIGLGIYSNSATSSWSYYTNSSTGSFFSGQGYAIKFFNNSNSVDFGGAMVQDDVSTGINTGSRTSFNLIGNPYTAYLNSATFASQNSALLTEETIWLWNGSNYETYNASNPIEIAPVQGFFVEAASNGNVTFRENGLFHNDTNTFKRQAPKPSFELIAESNGEQKSTKVFYTNNTTTDFDNGYDSSMFGGQEQNFAIYTALVSNNQGKKLAIQTLPNTDYDSMVIPIGLIADSGKKITFSVSTNNLPDGIEIYLEDRVHNSFTNLSKTNKTIITQHTTNGIGQYYIHTSSKTLSNGDITQDLQNVSIYQSNSNEITISGVQGKLKLNLYSVLGKELLSTEITSNGLSNLQIPKLITGIYLLKMSTSEREATKKIILK